MKLRIMNTRYFKNIIAAITVCCGIVTVTSCSDSYMENLNTDDSKVSQIDPNAQLTTSLLQTYGDFSLMDTYRNYITGFTQHFAGGWNVTNYAGSVHFENDKTRRIWDRYYAVAIKNLVDAIYNTADRPNLNAVLRIHRVYLTSVLADTYGDVPCSEAGLGYIAGISTPKYDTVEEIYNWFFEELDACEQQLGTGTDRITGDVTSMGGDVNKWKKYANSLRMRFAMRISDVEPEKAKQEFEKAMAKGYIDSDANDAFIIYSDSPYTGYDGANDFDFRTNALCEILYGQDPQSPTFICSTLYYQLKNTGDPRLDRIRRYYYNIKRSQIKPDKEENIDITTDLLDYFATAGRDEIPCNPGAAQYDNWIDAITLDNIPNSRLAQKAVSDPGTYNDGDYRARATRPALSIDFEMPTCPGILITYAEVEFLLAEAKTMGWNVDGTASSHYEAGVRASMEMLNKHYLSENFISDAEIDAFIQNNPLGTNPKETINTQAWILHLMNPAEAWANMRRSDYPAILDRTRLATFPNDGFIYDDPDLSMPTRLRYPELEGQYNSENYRAAINRMGGKDNWHIRLWWDKSDIHTQPTYSQPYGSKDFGYIN